jgi:hypothetical protein
MLTGMKLLSRLRGASETIGVTVRQRTEQENRGARVEDVGDRTMERESRLDRFITERDSRSAIGKASILLTS